MEMVSLSEFVHELRPLVNGFMPDMLPRSVLKAAIRFCEDTDYVTFDTTALATEENQQIDVSALLETDGVDLTGLMISNVMIVTGNEEPLYVGINYSEQSKGTITVFEPYDTLTITVSVKPTRTASSIPEPIFDDWLDAIVSGAAAYLYTLPDCQNGNLHQYYEREYTEDMRKAKRWRLESFSHQPFSPKTRQRDFF